MNYKQKNANTFSSLLTYWILKTELIYLFRTLNQRKTTNFYWTYLVKQNNNKIITDFWAQSINLQCNFNGIHIFRKPKKNDKTKIHKIFYDVTIGTSFCQYFYLLIESIHLFDLLWTALLSSNATFQLNSIFWFFKTIWTEMVILFCWVWKVTFHRHMHNILFGKSIFHTYIFVYIWIIKKYIYE